ncbi:MAG: ParB N-terminal domain-containing protein [Firmicutes bacterium]|nr:ParB N-terminal domain-containing protein [Bacillota bacterium]
MSVSVVPVKLLKPHPKNKEYYGDPDPEKYEEIKRSVEAHGIRDPLKVLPDYTIVAGHQRYRIALELGLEKVPVIVGDLPEKEAEYLLIADNEERRQSDDDPIRKAKRAKFLKEYWDVRRKSHNLKGQNVPLELKTMKDVAEAIGEDERTTKRLLKLNDLIPEFQSLVSSGEMGATAAYELAFLSPETQKSLHEHYGREISRIKAGEARELRKKIEEEIREGALRELEFQLAEKEKALEEVNRLLEKARRENEEGYELVNKLIGELNEKRNIIESFNSDPARESLAREIAELEKEKMHLTYEIEELKIEKSEIKKKRSQVDSVVGMANRALNPLLEFKGKLEVALSEIDDDPYSSLNMCFSRHIKVLEGIAELMRSTLVRLGKRVEKKTS